MFKNKFLVQRLNKLEEHLKAENPNMVPILPTFYMLDSMLYKMGLLDKESSLAFRISFWPVISLLGTFSAGKSSFINSFIGAKIQDSGNQAVDDKFTVICFSPDAEEPPRTLPGTALDADPRFPFYRISREIDRVEEGDGRNIDSYLQLRTTRKEVMRGRILIDSPGFDADDQRRSILRITDHILDLSDLVLVFFDARHPEPGAMQDTLTHLVAKSTKRTDSNKFLYVLNQIDTAANEDNPEAVISAWQRSLAQAGLVSGRFYCIYNKKLAVHIEDPEIRHRFESKRDADMNEIDRRVQAVDLQRSYRVVQMLETVLHELERDIAPQLTAALETRRKWVLLADGVSLLVVLAIVAALLFGTGLSVETFTSMSLRFQIISAAVAMVAAGTWHYWIRDMVTRRLSMKLPERFGQMELNLRAAFLKNGTIFHSILRRTPVGWGSGALRKVKAIREKAAAHVQQLNDMYTDPSGKRMPAAAEADKQEKNPVTEPGAAVAEAPPENTEPAIQAPAENQEKSKPAGPEGQAGGSSRESLTG